ncbi:MAG: hypothetical protein ACTS8H_04190 [Arsenophonus sp. NC-PE1-MAG3]
MVLGTFAVEAQLLYAISRWLTRFYRLVIVDEVVKSGINDLKQLKAIYGATEIGMVLIGNTQGLFKLAAQP